MASNTDSEILRIVEKLVTTGKKTLDENSMKQLKKICKGNDRNVNYAYYALMTQLRKEHSEIRYSSILIINEFFCRSSCFRKLLEIDLEEFMELVVETNPDNLLPKPFPTAKALKLKGLEFMKSWALKFGSRNIRYELALNYLKKCKKVDFDDMEARSEVQRRRHRQEQERLERIQNEKVNKVREEMQDTEAEITGTLNQIENCFRLLVPHPEEFFSPDDFEASSSGSKGTENGATNDEDLKDSDSLRHHGLFSMKKPITIQLVNDSSLNITSNDDTEPVIENLNDLHKQLSLRYFPMLTSWLKVLTKGTNCLDLLKKAIDLKQSIESAFGKYKDLKINYYIPADNCEGEEEDDDFEEVSEKEGYEADAQKESTYAFPPTQPSCSKQEQLPEKPNIWQLSHSTADANDPTSAVSTLMKMATKHKKDSFAGEKSNCSSSSFPSTDVTVGKKKSKLLDTAPVLPYDIDLYHWEDENPIIPERVKFDSLHKFWTTKNDEDASEALNKVQIASLRTRKIDFSGKFEPVKYACRAPLPSGKLCPRRDRYKCPFHGNIVQRDIDGNPVNSADVPGPSSSATTSATPDWQDPQLLREIEAATGVDLKVPEKGRRKRKGKQDGLTNIKKVQSTSRERLTKKILKRYKHYAPKMDDMERKKFNDKFGDQWNYY